MCEACGSVALVDGLACAKFQAERWGARGLQRARFGENDSRAVRRALIVVHAGAAMWIPEVRVADRLCCGCGAMAGVWVVCAARRLQCRRAGALRLLEKRAGRRQE